MSKRVVGLDFETEIDNDGNCKLLLCALYSEKYQRVFELENRVEMLEFIITLLFSGDKYVVFNASFDIEIIMTILLRNGYKFIDDISKKAHKTMKLLASQSKIYKLTTYTMWEEKKRIIETEYIDLGNIIVGVKLKDVAKTFTDLEKGDYEVSKKDWEKFKEYCLLDAKITYEAYKNICKQLDGNYITIGAASFDAMLKMAFGNNSKETNMKNFRAIYGDSSLEMDTHLRKWYIGGFGWCTHDERVELKVNSYDINSAYPYECIQGLPTTNDMLIYDDYKEPNERYKYAFYKIRATGQIKEGYAPISPSKNIYGDSNRYIYEQEYVYLIKEYGKKSEFDWWHENMEIEYYEVEETILMKEARNNIIKPFILHYYHIKETSTGVIRDLAKRIINSFTGKLGTNPIKDSPIFELDERNKLVKAGTFESETETYAVHCVAVITSRVRSRLYEMDKFLREKGAKFRMYATDSVKYDASIGKVIPTSDKMGGWDIEHEDSDFIFLGLKAYIFDANNKQGKREVICAGISKDYKQLIQNDEFFGNNLVKSLVSVRSGNGRIIYETYKRIVNPIKKKRRR